MEILVSFIVFHPDNYQGGSGESFEHKKLVEFHDENRCGNVGGIVHGEIQEWIKTSILYATPVAHFTITKMEILL